MLTQSPGYTSVYAGVLTHSLFLSTDYYELIMTRLYSCSRAKERERENAETENRVTFFFM